MFDERPRSQLVEQLLRFGRWLAVPPSERLSEDSADWYAGLCADPHSFSEELSRLQSSLRRAGNPKAGTDPVRRNGVETLVVPGPNGASLPVHPSSVGSQAGPG
jgi:hypothetical protein